MGLNWSESKEVTLKRLEVQRAQIELQRKIAEIEADIKEKVKVTETETAKKVAAIQAARDMEIAAQSNYDMNILIMVYFNTLSITTGAGIKWMNDWLGISGSHAQLAAMAAFFGSVRYGYEKWYQAKNIEFFETAATDDVREVYARRAGFADARHLSASLPSRHKLKCQVLGFAGLIGMPVVVVVYLVANNMRRSTSHKNADQST
jgi:hypothetical protein